MQLKQIHQIPTIFFSEMKFNYQKSSVAKSRIVQWGKQSMGSLLFFEANITKMWDALNDR